jgi:hypothetical protein
MPPLMGIKKQSVYFRVKKRDIKLIDGPGIRMKQVFLFMKRESDSGEIDLGIIHHKRRFL